MYGKRRALLGSLALLVCGSVLSAVAKSLTLLLAGRILQGCAAGTLPLSAGILQDEMPAGQLGPSLAVTGGAVGISGAIAFPLGGFLAQGLGWNALFWAAAGLGALAAVAVRGTVPASLPAGHGTFDWRGAAGLACGLCGLLLAVSQGPRWGWSSAPTLISMAVSVLGLPLWWRMEGRAPDPLVDTRTSTARPVLLINMAAFLTGFAMYGMSVIIPQVLQAPRTTGYGGGLSVTGTGLCLAPAGVAMLLLSPLSGRMSARSDPSVTLTAGAAFIAAGYALGITLPGGVLWYVAIILVVGAGLAFAFPAMSALILSAVPSTQSAAAGGLNFLIRSIGAAISSAALGALLGSALVSTGTDAAAPSPTNVRIAFAVACCAAAGGAIVAAICSVGRYRDRI